MDLIKYLVWNVSLPLLFLLIFGSSSAQNGKILLINKNNSWDNAFFSFYTSSSNLARTSKEMIGSNQIDTSKFRVEIPTNEPLLFNFSRNWKVQFVYLFPGDTLSFHTTSNDTIPFEFGGSRPYSELKFFSLLEAENLGYLSNSANSGLEVTKKLNFEYVADETFKRYSERLKFLDDQLLLGKFTNEGRETISLSIYYKYLSELLFPYESVLEDSFDNAVISNSYKLKIRELGKEFNKESLMYLRDYRKFVFLYARFLMLEEAGSKNASLSFLLDFYKRKFSGRTRDFLLYDEVYDNYLKSGDASKVTQVIDSIKDKAQRDKLISIQKESKKDFSQLAFATELETPEGKKITLRELMVMYSHKSIYMDFWATWCGPCLFEMPDSEKLTKEFKNADIEFVYISIDKDKEKWLKKITTLPNGKNTHHYKLNNGSAFIAKEMEISSVPWYILVGIDGQMISFNAPRPRSKEIRELISESVRIKN